MMLLGTVAGRLSNPSLAVVVSLGTRECCVPLLAERTSRTTEGGSEDGRGPLPELPARRADPRGVHDDAAVVERRKVGRRQRNDSNVV